MVLGQRAHSSHQSQRRRSGAPAKRKYRRQRRLTEGRFSCGFAPTGSPGGRNPGRRPACKPLVGSKSSPCIDVGTANRAPNVDFDGDPRPLDFGYDIGADEYRSLGADDSKPTQAPATVFLAEPYPNPLNPHTALPLELPRAARVRLAIYDLKGALVRALLDEELVAGGHLLRWDGK